MELWPFLIFQLQRYQPYGLSESNRWFDFRFASCAVPEAQHINGFSVGKNFVDDPV
jgi:hypothetical protein